MSAKPKYEIFLFSTTSYLINALRDNELTNFKIILNVISSRNIKPRDGTLTGTTSPDHSEAGSKGNEEGDHTPEQDPHHRM